MSNKPKPPIAINKASKVRAEVKQIDWGSHSVFVTFPNPDGDIDIGDFWDFGECDIFPFVCPDKNGKPVYAGDEATVTASDSEESYKGKIQLLTCIPVDGVPMPIEYLREDADKKGIDLEIELTESDGEE